MKNNISYTGNQILEDSLIFSFILALSMSGHSGIITLLLLGFQVLIWTSRRSYFKRNLLTIRLLRTPIAANYFSKYDSLLIKRQGFDKEIKSTIISRITRINNLILKALTKISYFSIYIIAASPFKSNLPVSIFMALIFIFILTHITNLTEIILWDKKMNKII